MFAARGGNQSQGYTYSGSNDINAVAWYRSNSGNTTHIVGTKAPNELGIFDMSGNVWEGFGMFMALIPGVLRTIRMELTTGHTACYIAVAGPTIIPTAAFPIGSVSLRPAALKI